MDARHLHKSMSPILLKVTRAIKIKEIGLKKSALLHFCWHLKKEITISTCVYPYMITNRLITSGNDYDSVDAQFCPGYYVYFHFGPQAHLWRGSNLDLESCPFLLYRVFKSFCIWCLFHCHLSLNICRVILYCAMSFKCVSFFFKKKKRIYRLYL